MVIDNFELIKPLFYFNEANGMFFHCQIVQRNNDFIKDKSGDKVLHTYFIRSREHLDRLKNEIIMFCELYNARAYINVSGKDFDSVNKELLLKLAIDIKNNNFEANPRKLLNSAAGIVKSRKERWVVYIDNTEDREPVYKWFIENGLNCFEIFEIPTVNGFHFITPKFNLNDFINNFPHIDVYKNSMGTLLYFNKKENG